MATVTGSIVCGNCKATHSSVEEVRSCYMQETKVALDENAQLDAASFFPASDKQVRFIMDLLQRKAVPADMADSLRGVVGHDLDKRVASEVIDKLLKFPDKEKESGKIEVPQGKFALPATTPNGPDYMFVEVKYGKNKWAGYTFLSYLTGAPGDFRRTPIRNKAAIATLVEKINADPAGAIKLFGQQTGVCGVCGSPLTDPVSVSYGIGPVCRDKTGW